MSEKNKLKPCPFCGSDSVTVINYDGNNYKSCYRVKCIDCSSDYAYSEQGAIDHWNRRQNPPPCNSDKTLKDLLKEEYIASHIDMIGTPSNSKERHLNDVFRKLLGTCLTDVEIEALQIAKHK